MSLEATGHPASEDRILPSELTGLPPLPWTNGIEVVLARCERRILNHALAQANGVKRRAALILGISRYALERRLTRVERTLGQAQAAGNPPASGSTAALEGRASVAGSDA